MDHGHHRRPPDDRARDHPREAAERPPCRTRRLDRARHDRSSGHGRAADLAARPPPPPSAAADPAAATVRRPQLRRTRRAVTAGRTRHVNEHVNPSLRVTQGRLTLSGTP